MTMFKKENFKAEMLKALRKEKGHTLMRSTIDIHKKTGRVVSGQQLSSWERGNVTPLRAQVNVLAKYYNLTQDDFFEEADDYPRGMMLDRKQR